MKILDDEGVRSLIKDLQHSRALIIYARDEENGFVYCTVKYPMVAMAAREITNNEILEETN